MLTSEQKKSAFQDRLVDFGGWPLKIILILLVASLISACSVLGQDNRQTIAMETMYGTVPGKRWIPVEVDSVITSALTAKFPAGTDIKQLNAFVSKLGGSCRNPAASDQGLTEVRCSLVESNTICINHTLYITASLDSSQTIRSLEARRYSLNC